MKKFLFEKRQIYQIKKGIVPKKLKILLCLMFFFLFFPFGVHAQTEIDKCFNYLNAQDYKRAIEAGKSAVMLYPRNASAYRCLGKAYYRVGEFKLALSAMKEAERLATTKSDLMYVYNLLGKIYAAMADFDNAFLYYSRCLNIAKEIGERNAEASMLNDIANIFQIIGEYDKALKYYEESLKLQNDEREKAATYNNIAVLYSTKGDFNKSIEYRKKAIEICERYGDYHGLARALINLGETYRRIKDFANAKTYLFKGLNLIKKINDKNWEAMAYMSLGWLYKDIGNKKLAREYLLKAYNIFKSIGAEKISLAILYELKALEEKN